MSEQMTLRKAAEMALEALNIQTPLNNREFELRNSAIEALRQALAQPEQEPWQSVQCTCGGTIYFKHTKREWVGLTDKDRKECWLTGIDYGWVGIMDATEAKLKEKNT